MVTYKARSALEKKGLLDTFWTSGHLCLLGLDTYGLEVFTPDGHKVIYTSDL